jgi:hypothetical protein
MMDQDSYEVSKRFKYDDSLDFHHHKKARGHAREREVTQNRIAK